MRVAILGGTGKEGRGLALRWARAGHDVVIGSRDALRARASAAELSSVLGVEVSGTDNVSAVAGAAAVVLSVPYAGHGQLVAELREPLQDRVVIDITVPLQPPKVRQVFLPPGGSAALEAQAILGAGAHVAASFHHVSAALLADLSASLRGDVLFCSDFEDARGTTTALVEALGLRAIDAGPLRNAIALEAMTPVLLHINKRYGVEGAGLTVAGISGSGEASR